MKMSKSRLDKLLSGQNREILLVLPEEPEHSLDEFILDFIGILAIASSGAGDEATQASRRLNTMRGVSYSELRFGAAYSADYADYERKLMVEHDMMEPLPVH